MTKEEALATYCEKTGRISFDPDNRADVIALLNLIDESSIAYAISCDKSKGYAQAYVDDVEDLADIFSAEELCQIIKAGAFKNCTEADFKNCEGIYVWVGYGYNSIDEAVAVACCSKDDLVNAVAETIEYGYGRNVFKDIDELADALLHEEEEE